MSFPALALRPGGELTAEATGVPSNGANVITTNLNLSPQELANDPNLLNWVDVTIQALGPSVTSASLAAVAADLSTVTVNFAQAGTDQARVIVTVAWTGER